MRLSATSHTPIHAHHHTHTQVPSPSSIAHIRNALLARIVDLSACLLMLPAARILSRLHATNTAHRCSDALGSLSDHQGCAHPTSRH